jgi:hypothetical protein
MKITVDKDELRLIVQTCDAMSQSMRNAMTGGDPDFAKIFSPQQQMRVKNLDETIKKFQKALDNGERYGTMNT